MALEAIFAQLEQLGMFDVLLPFILIFTIVFAILQKAHIFQRKDAAGTVVKDSDKGINSMIALVMGLGVVFPHVLGYYPPDQDIVIIINHALPNISVILVAILMAMLIIGLLGRRVEIGGNSLSGWVAILAFVLVIYVFGAAAHWWDFPYWLAILNNPDTLALVIFILVFAIIIWFITKDSKDESGLTAQQKEEMAKRRLPYQVSTWLK